jgi:hypothetical protein
MEIEQGWDLLALRPGHAALGADAPWAVAEVLVDEAHLVGGGPLGLLLRLVGHEREIELGVGRDVQRAERLEVGGLALVLGNREAKKFTGRPARSTRRSAT